MQKLKESKRNGVLCMFALACVAILLATSLVAVVGNNNTVSSTDNSNSKIVTYEGLCGVANDDGNIRSDSNTRVDSDGFVISTSDDDDRYVGEKESTGELEVSNGERFWSNNVQYEIYTTDGNRLKVVDYDSDGGDVRSFSIPDYIDHNGIRYTVTEIDQWGMTSRHIMGVWIPLHVDIGPSIVKINKHAFSAEFAPGALETFTIRNIEQSNLYKIEEEAFYKIKAKTIELPKSLTIMEQKAFKYSEVERVILHSETLDIGFEAFCVASSLKDINLEKVRHIGADAFLSTRLTDVDLSSATEIGEGAFVGKDTLRSVKFSPALASLHEKAFGWNGQFGCVTYYFYDTVGNEMGQCAELMHGKTFVRAENSNKFIQVL